MGSYFAVARRLSGCLPLGLVFYCAGEITWALRFWGAFLLVDRFEGAGVEGGGVSSLE